jgi:hypothetical protein
MDNVSFSYPLDDMHTTASTQRTLLEDSWQSHQHYLNTTILYPASQLLTEAAGPFEQHMATWSQGMQKYYEALIALADQLDQGATAMGAQDAAVARALQTDAAK